MQICIDVTCMYTDFGGRGISGFRDFALLQKWSNFPFRPWTRSMVVKKYNWLKNSYN